MCDSLWQRDMVDERLNWEGGRENVKKTGGIERRSKFFTGLVHVREAVCI